MSTCVETQTAGLHQLDNMTGLQKHPRTKAAASRYIVFFITLVYLNFLQDFADIMLSESNVFSSRNQRLRIPLDTSPLSQVPALPGSPDIFFLVLSATPCQGSIM
jgi:hypothetical protein